MMFRFFFLFLFDCSPRWIIAALARLPGEYTPLQVGKMQLKTRTKTRKEHVAMKKCKGLKKQRNRKKKCAKSDVRNLQS